MFQLCDGEKLLFENITVEGNVIRATVIPKEFGNIPFTLKIYDIPIVKDYINVTAWNPSLFEPLIA